MDLSNLTESELQEILNKAVEETIATLSKADPDHSKPGLNDDFAESDAVAEANGATAKAAEEDEDEDEDETEKKAMDCPEPAKKSSNDMADLVKAQASGIVSLSKAVQAINDKIEKLSKSAARPRKSTMTENDVETIEKGANAGNDYDAIINSNKRAVGAKLLDLHKSGKITGQVLTNFELFGVSKLPNDLKKSVIKEADLIK